MIPKKSTLESSSNFTIPTSIAVNLEPYALSHPSRPVNKWFWITYYFQVESNWVTQLDPFKKRVYGNTQKLFLLSLKFKNLSMPLLLSIVIKLGPTQ